MRSVPTPSRRIAADSESSAKAGSSSGPLAITPKKSRGTPACAPAGRQSAATRAMSTARRIGEA
jgi:hypothetical protein